jgi:hypothetical protein
MKNLFVLTVVILFGINNMAYSQDLILLKNGEEIKAVVNEVTLDLIKYKKFENPDGPIYSIEKRSVFMITYKNGSKDIFSEQPTVKVIEQEQKQEDPHQNSSLVAKKGAVRQNGKYLTKYDVRTIMASNSEALQLYNSGKNLVLIGDISGYVGLGVIVVAIIVEKNGNFKENSANMVGLVGGVTLLATSMTFTFTGRSKIKKSVNQYNSELNKARSYKIDFGINQNGIALTLNF